MEGEQGDLTAGCVPLLTLPRPGGTSSPAPNEKSSVNRNANQTGRKREKTTVVSPPPPRQLAAAQTKKAKLLDGKVLLKERTTRPGGTRDDTTGNSVVSRQGGRDPSPTVVVAVGMDFGTTSCSVAIARQESESGYEVVPVDGSKTMPSVVAILGKASSLVGEAAVQVAETQPSRVVFGSKRFTGRKPNDKLFRQLAKNERGVRLVANESGNLVYKIPDGGPDSHGTHGTEYVAEQIFRKLKTAVDEFLLVPTLAHVVLTVPVSFNTAQREEIHRAARSARLNVVRMINEPTAAAMAYKLDDFGSSTNTSRNALVYDLGGGTFDVTLLNVQKHFFEVLATGGLSNLGGDDLDYVLLRLFLASLLEDQRRAFPIDRVRKELLHKCRQAKHALSELPGPVSIEMSYYEEEEDSPTVMRRASLQVTRDDFEQAIWDKLEDTFELVTKTIHDGRLSADAIQAIALVGGSTRIPLIRSQLERMMPQAQILLSPEPETTVAGGAAIQAAVISRMGSVAGKRRRLLMDVVPASIGVEVYGVLSRSIIRKNSPVPISQSATFYTRDDRQTAMLVKILEGDSALSADQHLITEFEVDGIKPDLPGRQGVEITLDVSKGFDLTVTAVVVGKRNPVIRHITHQRCRFSEAGSGKGVSTTESARRAEERWLVVDWENDVLDLLQVLKNPFLQSAVGYDVVDRIRTDCQALLHDIANVDEKRPPSDKMTAAYEALIEKAEKEVYPKWAKLFPQCRRYYEEKARLEETVTAIDM